MGRLKIIIITALVLIFVSCDLIGFLLGNDEIDDTGTNAADTAVTDLVLDIGIPGGISIDDVVVTIDTNDAGLASGTQSYTLTHDLTVTNLTLTTFTNNNYTLEDLNAGVATSGVHIQLTLASGVFTLSLSKNAEGLGVDTFMVAREWTFSITGFDTPHNVDVTSSAMDAFNNPIPNYPTITTRHMTGSIHNTRELSNVESDRAADFNSEREAVVWDD